MIARTLPLRFQPLLLVAGFVIWSSAFVVLYGLNGLGCEAGWHQRGVGPVSLLRAVLLASWVVHLLAFIPLAQVVRGLSQSDDGPRRFYRPAAIGVTIAALAATIWTGAPVAVLSACV
jgi:hypothetical protein